MPEWVDTTPTYERALTTIFALETLRYLRKEQALEVPQQQGTDIMTADDLVAQVSVIQDVMRRVMREDEHYGTIPGTNKPTLYKPGAEKLSMTFRFAPKYTVERYDMGNGHREYEVICELYSINTGQFVGAGVGNCNTRETKYFYRTENTGKPVPK